MKNFQRLKRVSWKSKNNVYYYSGSNLKEDIKDFKEEISIIIYTNTNTYNKIKIETIKSFCISFNNLSKQDIQELKEMKESVEKIEKFTISEKECLGCVEAIKLSKNYYWKNIIIV
jgi:hypothetical protein